MNNINYLFYDVASGDESSLKFKLLFIVCIGLPFFLFGNCVEVRAILALILFLTFVFQIIMLFFQW